MLILHNIDRIGDRKVDSAKKTLTLLNPDVDVVTYDTRLDADNILDIISGYDVIVDGALADRQLFGDLLVRQPGGHQLNDLHLPLRELVAELQGQACSRRGARSPFGLAALGHGRTANASL
jgi:hypothetical protein